ncbi:MAG: polysaccharide deacetylase family protein [Gemmatimonadales bacterium]
MSARHDRPPGALVISLDLELAWGVRQRGQGYVRNLLGEREVIPRLLALFREFEVAATWAAVGFLFAASRDELERFSPRVRPAYANPSLSPFSDSLGSGEADDPLHFAPSLIEAIRRTPRMEIATHTFSHYYCGEPGQTADTFRADLEAARAIAESRKLRLSSIVFPRNQHHPGYDNCLLAAGITAYRGVPRSWMWRFENAEASATPGKRAIRLIDAYVGLTGHHTVPWWEVPQPSGLANVRASCFLRPYNPRLAPLERLRLGRIRRSIRAAARQGEIFHLWWHPHNFGVHREENLAFLRRVLEEFQDCRTRHGMRSLTMCEVDRLAGSSRRSGAECAAATQALA